MGKSTLFLTGAGTVAVILVTGASFLGLFGSAGIFVTALVGIGVALAAGWMIQGYEKSIAAVTADMQRIAQGDFQIATHGKETQCPGIAALREAMDALASSLKYEKGLSKGLIEGLPMPFLLVDTKQRTLFTNQACLDMLQIDGPVEKQYGRTLAEIFYNDPQRKTAVSQSIKDGKVFRDLEITIDGHKGGKRHVLANVYPLYNLDGECIGGFGLYVDMTALKEKETQICDQNEMIARSANQATGISNSMASAAEELAAQVEQASRGAEEQRSRTAETATAMEEMNVTVLEVARNASQAAEASDQSKVKAVDGAKIVGDSVAAINRVQKQSHELKENLGQLGHQAEQIGRIMNVIEDIADQTNLLALNAAIEAARAGDAGRGFAVVADEVRKLAEKTMNATKEVGQAITAIQQGTRSNIEGMDKAAEAIEEATRQANKSGEALQEILSLAEQAADQVRSIATAAEEQSATSEEINRGVDDINRIASETSEVMNQSAQAVSELARMAAELNAIIDEMRAQAPEECEA